ncbi:lysophospholipid acyltransferase family protein [Glaciimonas sp. Gout2]|uniref:lysophospholipid acyltransferase family protein n=1 Tax=unclassified Glaciimonas TaxID=2644401 RepID=UPI002B232C38|nr:MULTISPECIES: lysophospholipid acyltransferase family protein [unclassified Glaciimonas]MEB0013411.1 lysophospholipid acyltransferase family protein [Glaciimonas sp. Cout2]MEB0082678.1 lysophospholipid acyltransferase family protein [Glaciimonas sp. Gout2]
MIAYRLFRIIAHLFAGLLTCALVFPFTDAAGRHWRIRRWSIKVLAICRVTVEVSNPYQRDIASPALIIANHVSWLDIFVINSTEPCRFVAKSDIRDWPLIGWLCAQADTIFIARGKQRDVRRIFQGLVSSIHAGERVAFFPEGTTAAQGAILPFHANLFEAAVDAHVPIQPYALRYVDAAGQLHPAADFIGDMSFAQSMIAIMKAAPIKAELIQLKSIETAGIHRRDLAAIAHVAIAEALGQRRPEEQVVSMASVGN